MESDTPNEHASRRRIALLALLHQRPHSYKEIIAALDKRDLWIYDRMADASVIAQQQYYQFRRDLLALRHSQWQIKYDRNTKRYSWHNSPFKLSLNQSQIIVLATLHHTFAQKTTPYANDIQELLTFFVRLLPEGQQETLVKQNQIFNIDLHERTDYSDLDPQTQNEVGRAILCRQQLAFTYRSPRAEQALDHVIEPEPLHMKDGHVYLHGWSLAYEKVLRFRLDYIVPGTARMLSILSARSRPRAPSYLLRYHLTPTLARNSVSQHFPQQEVEKHPDGSATITAEVSDLFEARRILLSYGEHCLVEAPPELVEQMRIVAADFARKYLSSNE